MNIYLSSPSEKVLDEIKVRCPGQKVKILHTRARMPQNMGTYFDRYGSIIEEAILDGGPFSLNSSALDLTEQQLFQQLLTFTKGNSDRYKMIFSYDPNFKPDGLEHNQNYLLIMEEHGIPVVPVIHNMKIAEEDVYIKAGYDTIAIGKQPDKTNPDLLFDTVIKIRHYGVRVHLFGITDFWLLAGCPATSCDSKSWLNDAITGVVRYWNPIKEGYNKTDTLYFPNKLWGDKDGTILYNEYEHIEDFKKFIGSVGLGIKDLLGGKADIYLELLGMLYYKTIEGVVTDMHLNNPLFL